VRVYLALLLTMLVISCGSGGSGGSGSRTLSWLFPNERADGTILQLSEISSFRVYYGTKAKDYQNSIQVEYPSSSLNLSDINLTSGTYYFVVTTVDSDGRESLYSDEVVLTI
jgi:hypothetical protein